MKKFDISKCNFLVFKKIHTHTHTHTHIHIYIVIENHNTIKKGIILVKIDKN